MDPQDDFSELLRGRRVFLSAGIPESDWSDAPWQRHEIVEAVMATTRTALRAGANLVFGGHPLITPIVFDLASRLVDEETDQERVTLFQSLFFADVLPASVWDFREAPWAAVHDIEPAGEPDREASLTVMRLKMLAEPIAGAIFIGGKPGVGHEYEMVRDLFEGVPCYPIHRPGGTAGLLEPANVERELFEELIRSAAYGNLARHIVTHLARR